MPKITPADLQLDGFRAEQFGTPADFVTEGGMLVTLIAEVAYVVMGRVGSAAYVATTEPGIQLTRLRDAERHACAARLWRRRAAFFDGNASHAADQSPERNRREYLAHASASETLFEQAIAEFIGAADGPATAPMADLSIGIVETGRFRSVTA